jgi:hypothetical protein
LLSRTSGSTVDKTRRVCLSEHLDTREELGRVPEFVTTFDFLVLEGGLRVAGGEGEVERVEGKV